MPSALAIARDPDPGPASDFYIGRQSILDRRSNLVAFELLFRSGTANRAQVVDDFAATASVLHTAFNELGIKSVLGEYRGFINLSASMLLSDTIELLPVDRVVLEVLETVEITPQIVARCERLKELGFTIALDDVFCIDARYRSMLGLVDIVKVEVPALDRPKLASLARELKAWDVELLAEKVDTREQVDLCMDLGFDLFQGYFFARPQIITGKKLSPSEAALMRLMGLVLSDGETADIEQVFKQDPALTVNLLRLVNSVACSAGRKMTSLGGALMVLGRRQLQRWLQLLLYASCAPSESFPSALLQLAATRGKLMELLAAACRPGDKELHDQAYMSGLMSLLDALLGRPLDEVLGPLEISENIRAALLERSGKLGRLLALVEAVEQSGADRPEALITEHPELSSRTLNEAQAAALCWANNIGRAGS